MKSTAIWTLAVLNVALLLSFLWRVMPTNSAIAQQAVRRPGDYLLIPATVSGASTGIVVAVDQTNGLLSAVTFDESTGKTESMQKLDLKQIFQQTPASRGAAVRPGY